MTRTIDQLKRDLHHAHQRHAMAHERYKRHRLSEDDEVMIQASQQIDRINAELDALYSMGEDA